jgi:hypothetical protein
MRQSCGLIIPATGRLAVLLPLLVSGLTTGAHAQYTWTGAGANSNWSNSANWSTAVPVSGASTTLDFTGTATAADNDIADPFTLNSVSFDVTSTVFNMSGGTLNFVSSSGATPTLNQNVSAAITLNNNLTLGNDLTITGSGKGTVTLAGAISGTGQLIISANATIPNSTWVAGTPDPGAFTTIISSTNNTYTGADTTYGTTYIAGGVLQLGADNALPIGTSSSSVDLSVSGVEADSTFDLHGHNQTLNSIYLGDIENENSQYATTIMDSGTTKGTLTLNGDISFDGGSLTIAPAAVISCNLSLASGNHNIFNPNGDIGYTGYDVVISGLVSGAGGLTATTGTNIVLSHTANTFTGATVIQGGNLYLDAVNALSSNDAVKMDSDAGLYLYIPNDATPQAGVTVGKGFNQSIGSLNMASTNTFGTTVSIYLGHAQLTIGNDNSNSVYSGLISDNDGLTSDTGVVGGSIVKVGTGSLTLSGDNSDTNLNSVPYTGSTTVQNGNLLIGANGALPSTTSVLLQVGAGLTGSFQTGAFSDTIGNLTVNNGTAVVNNGGALTVANVTLSPTSTSSSANIVIANGGALTSAGAYNQSGGITQVDGALNLKNNSTLQLTGGQLVGTGSVASTVTTGAITINNNGGIVSPGDVITGSPTGTLNIKGNYTQTSTGTLQINLGGTAQGSTVLGYDLLTVLDKASLAGTLDVNLVNNFTPTVNETFDFLTYGSLSGAFTTISSLNSGYSYSVSYNSATNTGILTVLTAAVPETSTLLSAGLMLSTGGLLLLRKRR